LGPHKAMSVCDKTTSEMISDKRSQLTQGAHYQSHIR
jgi:hypothetical protein